MGKVYCRFHKSRVRTAREALKLTKAELARRAMLTPAQYAHFEPAKRDRTHGTCTYIPREWVLRLATALGVTPEFLATGATNAKVLPPNDPRKALLVEIEKERKRTAKWQRKHERDTATLNAIIDRERRTVDTLTRMGEAAAKMRADDIAYITEMLKSEDVDRNGFLAVMIAAVERAERGEPMRPDPEEAKPFGDEPSPAQEKAPA